MVGYHWALHVVLGGDHTRCDLPIGVDILLGVKMNSHEVYVTIRSTGEGSKDSPTTTRSLGDTEIFSALTADELKLKIDKFVMGLDESESMDRKYKFNNSGLVLITQWRDGRIDVEVEKGDQFRTHMKVSQASLFRLFDLFSFHDAESDQMVSNKGRVAAWFTGFEFNKEISSDDD